MLSSQKCYIAKDEKGNIAGVIFRHLSNKDNKSTSQSPSKTEYIQLGWPCDFIPVLLLLDQLCHHQKILNIKNVSHLIDIFAIVIKTSFRCQGLASQLLTKTLNGAQALNISLVTITCTSFFTQWCSIKLGFTIENTKAYNNCN
jgi:hypothetical protein